MKTGHLHSTPRRFLEKEDKMPFDSPPAPDPNLRRLEAALMRVDVLLHRAVLRWQQAGQDPNDPFRGQYVSDHEAQALLRRPFGASWGQTVALSEREGQAYADALAQVEQLIQEIVETAEAEGRTLRLDRLIHAFDLTPFDRDALLICLAPTLDLRYGRIYGYLQDDVTRRRPGVNVVLDLLCLPGANRLTKLAHFYDDAPLFKHCLLQRVNEPGAAEPPLLSQTLRVDEAIVAWLLGDYQPHADLAPHATLQTPQPDVAHRLLGAPLDEQLCVDPGDAEQPIFVFHGPDAASQAAAARCLAARLGRSLLTVDLGAAIDGGGRSAERALRLALRDARLTGAVPHLTGWDACLAEENRLPPRLLAELCAHPDPVIVAGQAHWRAEGVERRSARRRALRWIHFPIPAFTQRHALWRHFLDEASDLAEVDAAPLAGHFMLTTGQIRDVIASARDAAAQRGDPLTRRDLFAAARVHASARLSSLALKIAPRYTWRDIVLPNDQLAMLHEIVDAVRQRPRVLDEWGLGRKLTASAGATILFAGPPGTGKTMAAEVMAAELGLDLYKIDLSTVVSKYIGETEKNLERIFEGAEHSSAILFFDEADALFGKRSEVRDSHDRYANIEISYLLQRMEAYDGVTILATNLRANLDEAFTRRLQFAVDFPFPEEAYRRRIWETLFPDGAPHAADLDFALMARRFRLAGGNIRNIIVNAAYLAAADGQEVTMAHLLHGARRELQKMGRLIPEEDLTIERIGE